MRAEWGLWTLLLAGPAVAGCLDNAPTPGPVGGLDTILADLLLAIPLEVDHDHADVSLHGGSYHIDPIAYAGLNDDGGQWVYGEADVVGDYAYVATLAPKGGFVVVDLRNPEAPAIAGRYTAATTYAADVKVTEDGRYAILGSQETFNDDQWMPPMHLPPVDASSLGINGFQVVSLADRAHPKFESFLPVEERGVHMLDLQRIGGETYAFGAPGSGGHVAIARLAETPAGAALVPAGKYLLRDPVSTAVPPPVPPPVPRLPRDVIGPHDVTVYDDELAKKPLMLVAAGLDGVQLVDVSDPAMPKRLGAWHENDGRYVHTVMPAIVEGRRLIVATPEVFASSEQQPLWVLDATEPANIHTIGVWRVPTPDRLGYEKDYRFSTHNTNIRDGIVYLSHFHAGLWVLDISTLEKAAAPEVRGAFVPAESGNLGVGIGLGLQAAPLVWDAIPLDGGRILVADIPTGMYIVSDPTVATIEAVAPAAAGNAYHGTSP